MKLFVIAALITVAAAARLEHLERSYLHPDHEEYVPLESSFESNGDFGANSGAFGVAGTGFSSRSAGGAFAGATSKQYLPPDHGPSATIGSPQFAGSLHGFGGQNFHGQQYNGNLGAQQYGVPQPGSFGPGSFQVQYPQPASSFQSPPQQAFDEKTGYHY